MVGIPEGAILRRETAGHMCRPSLKGNTGGGHFSNIIIGICVRRSRNAVIVGIPEGTILIRETTKCPTPA